MKVARNQACLAIPKDDEAETRGTKNTLTTTDSSAAYVGATHDAEAETLDNKKAKVAVSNAVGTCLQVNQCCE